MMEFSYQEKLRERCSNFTLVAKKERRCNPYFALRDKAPGTQFEMTMVTFFMQKPANWSFQYDVFPFHI